MLASYRHYLATGQANVVKPAAIFGE